MLDEGTLLFVSAVESSSCPLEVSRVGEPGDDVAADVRVELTATGGGDCSSDASPVTFAVASPASSVTRVFVDNDGSTELSGVVVLDG